MSVCGACIVPHRDSANRKPYAGHEGAMGAACIHAGRAAAGNLQIFDDLEHLLVNSLYLLVKYYILDNVGLRHTIHGR